MSPIFALNLDSNGTTVNIINIENSKTIPQQQEALACKTHKEVLFLLKKIDASEIKESFSFHHAHNKNYENHDGNTIPKGKTHECSLESQISFVELKISEENQGIRPLEENYWCILL